MLKVDHNSGFFSCCSMRLIKIVDFFNKNKALPDTVDSSRQFTWYKNSEHRGDITYHYFSKNDNQIPYNDEMWIYPPCTDTPPTDHRLVCFELQFCDYKKLNFSGIESFISKYFAPNPEINEIIRDTEKKYNIEDYSNICVVFYRGNDKKTETHTGSHEEYIQRSLGIMSDKPNTRFLIQSDETEFIEKATKSLPNTFYFQDEIRHMKGQNSTVDKIFKNDNYQFSKYFLAITIIMSRCEHIVCGSGNCSLWIALYRGHATNIHQYLSHKKERKHVGFNPRQTYFWV